MPIYEYECECGAVLESLEAMGTVRERCGELCVCDAIDAASSGGVVARGEGRVSRLMSASGIRGDGREAREPVYSPVKRQKRPGCEDCDCGVN